MLTMVEAGAWVIVLYARRSQRIAIPATVHFPATVALSRMFLDRLKAAPAVGPIDFTSNRPFLYAPDPLLGWTIPPGRLEVTLTERQQHIAYQFAATILPDGTRATSYDPPAREQDVRRRVFLFGDSIVWGWGLQDEQTFPWLLAARFPQVRVINAAQNGYGNTQALLQLRALEPDLRPNDIVVVVYGPHLLERTVATPLWLSGLRWLGNRWSSQALRAFQYPFARLGDHGLEVDTVDLFCYGPSCRRRTANPSIAEQVETTEALFDVIASLAGPRLLVAFQAGPDGDRVVAHLIEHGIAVADIRSRSLRYEADTLQPFDSHPGPIAQYYFAAKLADALAMRLHSGA